MKHKRKYSEKFIIRIHAEKIVIEYSEFRYHYKHLVANCQLNHIIGRSMFDLKA